jgi:putative transposase
MEELLEEELVSLVGPKGKHDAGRTATRHGSRRGQVVLGGRKVSVPRPRARTLDGHELPLRTYAHFASDDLLAERTVQTILAGLSTRRHRSCLEPTGTEDRSVSRSAVSRRFVRRTRRMLAELMARPVPDDLLVLMLDGVVLAGSTCLVALGIRADGSKVPLGIWEGASENAAVCRRALADLQERGLSAEHGLLVVIDGSKALRRAVADALGERAPVQRCRRHKEVNVLGHLPEAERPWVRRKLREAWALADAEVAERRLRELARSLDQKRPGAAASLREGLQETLTLSRLGIGADSALGRTLQTTNPIESMLSVCRERARNVKRWRGGEMALRWTAAGMIDAERSFRRVKGFRDLPKLQAALRAHAVDVDRKEVEDFEIAA